MIWSPCLSLLIWCHDAVHGMDRRINVGPPANSNTAQRQRSVQLLLRAVGLPAWASEDTLAEWLRRRPAKPMESPRVGSNPTGVGFGKCNVVDQQETTPKGFEPLRAKPN